MSWDALSQQLLAKHSVKVDAQALQKLCCATANAPTDASLFSVRDAFQRVLNANLQELVSAPGLLPRNTGSLPQATLEAAVVVQIQTARDATQPLRPCADMDDAEALLSGAANQKQTSHRLLRLTVTDGVVEVPAIELQTLCAFRSIPTPGEKLLLKVGTEVRGGMVIMTDKDVEWLGGCEQHLRDEHALRKHRALIGGIGSGGGGLEGAPKFAPLEAVGAVRAATAAPGLHHHKQPMHGIGKPEQHHPQGRSNAHGDPQGRGGSASTRGGGDGQHRGGSRGGRGTASRGRGDDRHAGRGHGAGSRGGRGGHGDQHRHQHHHDPRGGSAGYVGGRGHGAGGYRGGTATAAFPPPQPSRPAMPQFTDADFPSLGGDW